MIEIRKTPFVDSLSQPRNHTQTPTSGHKALTSIRQLLGCQMIQRVRLHRDHPKQGAAAKQLRPSPKDMGIAPRIGIQIAQFQWHWKVDSESFSLATGKSEIAFRTCNEEPVKVTLQKVKLQRALLLQTNIPADPTVFSERNFNWGQWTHRRSSSNQFHSIPTVRCEGNCLQSYWSAQASRRQMLINTSWVSSSKTSYPSTSQPPKKPLFITKQCRNKIFSFKWGCLPTSASVYRPKSRSWFPCFIMVARSKASSHSLCGQSPHLHGFPQNSS